MSPTAGKGLLPGFLVHICQHQYLTRIIVLNDSRHQPTTFLEVKHVFPSQANQFDQSKEFRPRLPPAVPKAQRADPRLARLHGSSPRACRRARFAQILNPSTCCYYTHLALSSQSFYIYSPGQWARLNIPPNIGPHWNLSRCSVPIIATKVVVFSY